MVTCDYTTDWDPGPWTTEEQWHGTGIKSGQRTVARVNQRADARVEASNARLVAAAPDLLAALESMECGGCHLKMTESYNRPCPDCAPAFTAIRAARGLEDL